MPQYLVSVWHDEPYDDIDFNSPDMQRIVAQVNEVNASLEKAGAWVFAAGLRPASSATVVRASGAGDVSMTDGPYAETKEQLGGFFIVEAKDLDEAVELASKMPHLQDGGAVEIRPIWPMD